MDDRDRDDWWEFESYQGVLYRVSHALAELVFLSDNRYLPTSMEDYNLGHLEPEDWWPLVNQLDAMVDLESLVDAVQDLDALLGFPGVPSEALEDPLGFLSSALAGELPREPSGRRVSSRKLVKLAQQGIDLLQTLSESAQAAVRAWADVHRSDLMPWPYEFLDVDDWHELLLEDEHLPPSVTGFSMIVAMTLMLWPERAEGVPFPPDFLDPELYEEVLRRWEALPDTPAVTEEGTGEAETLFAQGQLAHMLAQMGAVELMSNDNVDEQDMGLAYSRLSRAVLWIHDQCRHCPEREGVACKVATNWDEQPVPLLEVSAEIANTGRIGGCIKM